MHTNITQVDNIPNVLLLQQSKQFITKGSLFKTRFKQPIASIRNWIQNQQET